MSYSEQYDPQEGIAIIGMAGRFPGARTVHELWQNLLDGRESISRFTQNELEPAHREDMLARLEPGYVCARGVLDDADCFDEAFFGFSPAEAALLDPQQRLFLQAAWHALEHAGLDPQTFAGPIGVYAGGTANSYYLNNLLSRPEVTDRLGLLTTQMANQGHYIATRTAYKLDLRGPALNIHTACSTSMVAVCTAVQSLQSYQCDLALAGGVSVTLPQKRGYLYQEGSILAPDGHCRAFDAAAGGTVFSNGLGIVVLRRLSEAIEAGDTIYAVIKGAALNNDGSGKLSFTAPSVDGQAEVVALAQAMAGIDPHTISYVEAHGTGTALGDPIEVAALTQAFRAGGATGKAFCGIGSLKTNIGHLDAAAGVAGLIKTALALHHRVLPASLHFRAPNPDLNLGDSPFFVNDQRREWPSGPTPRRAGVSSFGVGGTNAHVVLEEAPRSEPFARAEAGAATPQLLVLSARDDAALERAREQLLHLVSAADAPALADLAWSLQTTRRAFERRVAWVGQGHAQAIDALSVSLTSAAQVDPATPVDLITPSRPWGRSVGKAHPDLGVAFLFPGQGAQRVNVGRGLYHSEAVFRREIDAAADVLRAPLGLDLRDLLFPAPGQESAAQQQLDQTIFTQPALLAVELALAQHWVAWGVRPQALLGHSVGEFAAACLAGTFSRDDVLLLVAQRARLMQELPAGAMLAVQMPADSLQTLLAQDVGIAALNAPQLTVVSGPLAAIDALQAELDSREVAWRRLATSHAFHSAMMEPVIGAFCACVERTPRQAPHQPWISSLTGTWVTAQEATGADFWARQLRQPVQFTQAMGSLLSVPHALLEVGPGQALTQLARKQPQQSAARVLATSLLAPAACDSSADASPASDAADEAAALRAALGRLWCAGVAVDWTALHGAPRQRVVLPTYPFARNRRWVDPAPAPSAAASAVIVSPAVVAPRAEPDTSLALAPTPATTPAPALQPASPSVAGLSQATVAAPPLPIPATMNSPASQPSDPRPALTAALQGLFADLAGLAVADVSPQASFLELGLDSLTLTQASQAIHKRYGVRVPMRQLLESCPDVDSLAEQLQAQMSPQALAAFVPAVASPAASMPSDSPAPAITVAHLQPAAMTDGSPQQTPVAVTALSAHPRAEAWGPLPVGTAAGWMELMAQQLAVMSRQLEVMRGAPLASALAMQPAGPAQPLTVPQRVAPAPPVAVPQTEAAMSPGLNPGSLAAQPEPAPSATADKAAPTAGGAAFGPYRPPVTRGQAALTEAQREALRRFIDDYSTRTAGSKRATQDHRAHLADPRSVAGFRMAWKELVYPLVTVRSAGSRLWDVDGHEYIDITNGFGMILFGHNPAFVRDAVQAQLEAGYEIGPQTPLAGEVAQALCEMTGMERAAFCGSGSEAVTAAIRVARTVTGRDTIVMFNGAYHGIFDEVLVRPGQALAASGADASALAAVNRSLPRSLPIAPGIPQAMADNIVVLEYGSPQALPTIKSLGPRLAAVLVEPVQSRRPDLQPREFLHELRALTSECGAALVFDEVVTGFRVHPGGAQAVFGVKADIATYGKVLGGGLPIGAVAGSARFMDALDGGAWQFGDDSAPEVGVTFFAGTFVRHPLALAAARAVLRRLKAEGPQLQRELNLRTTRFVESLRAMAQTMGAPLQVPHFASWFCLQLPSELPLAPLFFAALRLRGVHVWEGRPCFLTLAHTDDDLRTLIEAVRGALLDMQLHGFLPSTPTALPQAAAAPMSAADEPPLPGARRGHDPQGREAWFVPDPQRPGKYLQIRNESTSHG